TALIQIARPECDEVLIRLESPGGLVHSYGLAASQLARLKKHNIKLTVSVDKIAASGGYMMAVIGQTIISAPFAILGSIGVVANVPNLNRLLKKNDLDYYEFTAGEYKRTVTMLGEITEKGKQKFLSQLDETHTLFKEHIRDFRPQLSLSEVSSGEHWFGTRALELNLVDKIQTSDDYLLEMSEQFNIYHVYTKKKETLRDKLAHLFKTVLEVSVLNKKAVEQNLTIPLV
ncbi:MAG: protease SohB, partial [Silvanigrellaceae bacterium]|nr:protease SohB [Silvanigrellaceae bacterium]